MSIRARLDPARARRAMLHSVDINKSAVSSEIKSVLVPCFYLLVL